MKYSPQVEEKRYCANPNCNELVRGKASKKFCNNKCRCDNHNKIMSSLYRMNDINWQLEKKLGIAPPEFTEDIVKSWEKESDAINPSYYGDDIQCIDAIKASMTKEEFKGYLKGSIMKYIWREKDNKKEDLEKSEWFISKLKSEL